MLVFLLTVCAQDELPLGIVRGNLRESNSTGSRGSFLFVREDGIRCVCRFDERTWFESQRVRVSIDAFGAKDPVEVLADQRIVNGVAQCYARTVRLIEPNAPPPNPKRPVYRSVTEHIVPRGNLSFAAVVTRITPDAISIRTRADGVMTLLLRPDTRFLSDGVTAERGNLHVNQKVFLRGGKNLEGDLEVYQVIWGDIVSGR